MDDDGVKFVQPIRVIRIVNGIEQPQLHWKRNPIGEFDVLLNILLVLEPLKVQRQDVRKFLDLHPLFSFLKITATIAEELVLLTQHLAGAKLTETSRHGRVLFDVDRQV